jgi:thiol-disulfide isomerase/thioredoxin
VHPIFPPNPDASEESIVSRPLRPLIVLATVALSLAGPPAHAADQPAPQFSVRALDGRTIRLSDFHGRPVIVDFWATWCAPCRATMPHLNAMQERYRDQGLVVIGLSVDDGGTQKVRRFVQDVGVNFRIAMADDKVLDQYGPVRFIPTMFFINRKGEMVRRIQGALDAETVESYVKELFE